MSDGAYLCQCVDCGKDLVSHGTPPARPICLHCDIVRAAPEDMREQIRKTLQPLEPTAAPSAP